MLSTTLDLFPVAFAIALVGYMTSISVAKKVADVKKYEINPSQELIALGMANFIGSFFSSFTGAGSLSKTMVNTQSGANTPFSTVVSVMVMVCVILFMTPVFYYLPYLVLGVIVVMAVIGLIEIEEAIALWKLRKRECLLWIITVLATLLLGIINGMYMYPQVFLVVFGSLFFFFRGLIF